MAHANQPVQLGSGNLNTCRLPRTGQPGASRSVEFLGEADKKPFRPADVADPIRILILDYFAYELGAALAKPVKRLVDVVNREHDAEGASSVHRGVAVICDNSRREETRELETAVAVRCAHHGNLDALIGKSGDTSCPFSFDRGPPLKKPIVNSRSSTTIPMLFSGLKEYEAHLSGPWNFMAVEFPPLFAYTGFASSIQRYAAKVVLWLDVWDLTAPVERRKGREPQVSTRTPLLSLSNSPTRRPIHQAKPTVQRL
jgi:hypothetical protein